MTIDDFEYLARCNGLHLARIMGYGAFKVYLKPVNKYLDMWGNTRIDGKYVAVSMKEIFECDRDGWNELITQIKLQLLFD